jgi:hypothetical protein
MEKTPDLEARAEHVLQRHDGTRAAAHVNEEFFGHGKVFSLVDTVFGVKLKDVYSS